MARIDIYLGDTLIDLSDRLMIALTLSLSDIVKPEARRTSFSKTIVIPGSKTNNKVFDFAFNVNSVGDFDPNASLSATVIQDGFYIIKGTAQLLSVNLLPDNNIEYEIVLFGEIKSLFSVFGESLLKDTISFTEYNHAQGLPSMEASWDDECFIDDVLTPVDPGTGYWYPHINYLGPAQGGYDPLNLGGQSAIHYYPALHLKEYIDKIFEAGGFTYTSTLFESDYFKSIIIPYNGPMLSDIIDPQTVDGYTEPIYTNTYLGSETDPTVSGFYWYRDIDFAVMIDQGIKVRDFLLNVIKAFNLHVDIDKANPNNIIIDSYDNFYTDDVIDWSSKVDYSKPIKIKPTASNDKRFVFQFGEVGGFKNGYYKDKKKHEYGGLILTTDNAYSSSDRVVSAPSFGCYAMIPDVVDSFSGLVAEPMVYPYLSKWNPDEFSTQGDDTYTYEKYQMSQTKIQLLFKKKNTDRPLVIRYGFEAIEYRTYAFYPYAGHLDDPYNPTEDLTFGQPLEVYWGSPADIGTAYPNADNLYTNYYQTQIESLVSSTSKMIEMYLRLNASDISLLDFKKKYFIKDAYYRINIIHDYIPGSSQSTKVELIKIP